MKAQATVEIKNKKAFFEYDISDKYICGIALKGTEIKSIRQSKASIKEAFCRFKRQELFVINMFINEYEHGGYNNHLPKRDRKLLLEKNELKKLKKQVQIKGFSLLPLKLFINQKGLAKLQIGLGKGKKIHDKRESLKQKDTQRNIDRALKQF